MRFILLVIPKVYEHAGADFNPPADLVAKMTRFNESMTAAGVLMELNGLRPPAAGARVQFAGGKTKVIEGPFPGATQCVGGYWMLKCKSQEDAVEWARRAPMLDGDIIEVRGIQEMEDFPADVRKAAGG